MSVPHCLKDTKGVFRWTAEAALLEQSASDSSKSTASGCPHIRHLQRSTSNPGRHRTAVRLNRQVRAWSDSGLHQVESPLKGQDLLGAIFPHFSMCPGCTCLEGWLAMVLSWPWDTAIRTGSGQESRGCPQTTCSLKVKQLQNPGDLPILF